MASRPTRASEFVLGALSATWSLLLGGDSNSRRPPPPGLVGPNPLPPGQSQLALMAQQLLQPQGVSRVVRALPSSSVKTPGPAGPSEAGRLPVCRSHGTGEVRHPGPEGLELSDKSFTEELAGTPRRVVPESGSSRLFSHLFDGRTRKWALALPRTSEPQGRHAPLQEGLATPEEFVERCSHKSQHLSLWELGPKITLIAEHQPVPLKALQRYAVGTGPWPTLPTTPPNVGLLGFVSAARGFLQLLQF